MDQNKYLVHGCLEGPEAGVYYRGKVIIPSDSEFTSVTLPNYVPHFTSELTVHLTHVFKGRKQKNSSSISDVNQNGVFMVYGDPGEEYNWIVYGKRYNIEVEPNKSDYQLKGSGPYTWIEKN